MKIRVKGDTKGINLKDNGQLLIPAINGYLKNIPTGSDRKHGWNSPSGVGGCPRNNYFLRIGLPFDYGNEPRLQRIFDNGTYTHIRLQEYMTKQGVLLADEAPLFNIPHKIMGTTDGILLDGNRLAVLEIKSINSFGFNALKEAKPEHQMQASIYLYCLNEMQKEILRGNRKQLEEAYFNKINSFLTASKHHTKEEKVTTRFNLFKKTLDLLEKYPFKIHKVYFLYENKDTQELKEFCFTDTDNASGRALKIIEELNANVEAQTAPLPQKTYMCNGCRFRKVCKTFEQDIRVHKK